MQKPAETRLLKVAIEMFGREGMSATGTRAIADAAGVQMSAITYHFGGKEELYLACARHIAAQIRARLDPLIEQIESSGVDDGGPQGARRGLLALLSGFVTIMMKDEIAPVARFVVREQMSPTAAFSILYEQVMQRELVRIGELLQRVAQHRLPAEQLRLRSIALIGQILAFRFARATLMRTTGWQRVGAAQTEAARSAVLANAAAILDGLAREAQ